MPVSATIRPTAATLLGGILSTLRRKPMPQTKMAANAANACTSSETQCFNWLQMPCKRAHLAQLVMPLGFASDANANEFFFGKIAFLGE